MKNLSTILLVLISIICSGFSAEISISFQPNVDKLESMFKANLPSSYGIIYTKEPRGLVLSIDEKYFFSQGESRIKESSLFIINIISDLLQEMPNYCVVENHTEEIYNGSEPENWELSMNRSSNIVEYMIKCGKVAPSQLFALGYGEFMPFKDNVSPNIGINNRIDFVILEYEAKR